MKEKSADGWLPGTEFRGADTGDTHFKVHPPAGGIGTVARPRLVDALTHATQAHRITVVEAPAGYGKTAALTEWARLGGVPCAWLSADRFDAAPARLFRWVVASLQAAAEQLPLPDRTSLLALDQNLHPDPARSYDRVLETLGNLSAPVVLVIDDLHVPGRKVGSGILGMLAASGPSSLRLVFSSRGAPSLPMERIRHGQGLSELGTRDLAFTRDEARQLAATLGPAAMREVDAVWHQAAGWPVAVHRSLKATARIRGSGVPTTPEPVPGTALTRYVAEEVLDQLPQALAEFVLRGTIADRISRRLAVELSAKPNGGRLLHECIRRSLFIEETEGPGDEPAYRWQPLFAAQCRHILELRDPLLYESLHRTAARHHRDTDVVACVAHALRGRDPLQAVAALGAHWLEFVLRNDTDTLEELCLELPYPWSDDAEVLALRSACRSFAGDADSAAALFRRALSRAGTLDAERHRRFQTSHRLFELFIGERRPALRAAADAGRRLLDVDSEGMWAVQATGVLLLGQAEVRLQRDGAGAIHLLRTAAAGGAANRLEAVEVCSSAELALGLALSGDLVAAQEAATHTLERAGALGWRHQGQLAPAWLAEGIADYWRNDVEEAGVHLSRGIRAGRGAFPIGALLRLYRVLADCALGDPPHLAEAHTDLEAAEDWRSHGLPGIELRTIAAAKVAEAIGDPDGALDLVRPLAHGGTSPLVTMLVAELLRRGGEDAAARRCALSLAAARSTPYIDTGLALTEALLADASGDSATAHERVEHAAAVAERQSIVRPFIARNADLEDLLIRHLAWGTAHESFIAARTAQHGHDHTHRPPSYWALTERELEVLTYMRSMMTAADIAKGLFVSVNTVKTHQRSIYRKLGVASRREALRIAVERGLT